MGATKYKASNEDYDMLLNPRSDKATKLTASYELHRKPRDVREVTRPTVCYEVCGATQALVEVWSASL